MKILITLLFCLSISRLSAQQTYLTGTVTDHSTQKVLAEVSLTVLHKQIGTVSNMEGKFMLLKNNIADADSILISCVGYQSVVERAGRFTSDQSQTIYLKPEVFVLDEVVIKPLSLVAILKEAIDSTEKLIKPENRLNAYYKEFAYLDQELFKFADAAVVYTVDNKNKKTKVEMQVIESRIKKDSLTNENKWKSDIESLIKSDKAMKSYYNLDYLSKLVNPKNTDKFNYKMETSGPVTKISVDPKPELKQYLPNAIIYFNTVSNRILKVKYGYISNLKYMPKVNLIFMAYSCEKDNITAIYSEGPVPYLRYCRMEQDIRFKLGSKKGLLGSVAEILASNSELSPVVLTANPKVVPAVYKKYNIYNNGNKFSPDFWLKYNTILPTATELKALEF